MSRKLSKLLGADESLFAILVRNLEKSSGNRGIDIRLAEELEQKARSAMIELGLDPHDTTGEELYRALQNKVLQDDDHLTQILGMPSGISVEDMIPDFQKIITRTKLPIRTWAIKRHVARELLRKMPPRQVMKRFGHKTADALIKAEDVLEIYGAVYLFEKSSWLQKLTETYKELDAADFEERDVQIIALPKKLWNKSSVGVAERSRPFILQINEIGASCIVPPRRDDSPAFTIATLAFLLHSINEIRAYAAYIKLNRVRADFGEIVAGFHNVGHTMQLELSGNPVDWRSVHRHYGSPLTENFPEHFEPHVQSEDFQWRTVEDTIYRIDKRLGYWQGLSCTAAMIDGALIPLGLLDNAESCAKGLSFDRRITGHSKQALWSELWARYIGQSPFEQQILLQLESDRAALGNIGNLKTLKMGA